MLSNEWLSNQSKRKLKISSNASDKELLIGKYDATEIINNIWESYIDSLIDYNSGPSQCTDINKYLFELVLANAINVKSIKSELLELYKFLSNRIAIMYYDDNQ